MFVSENNERREVEEKLICLWCKGEFMYSTRAWRVASLRYKLFLHINLKFTCNTKHYLLSDPKPATCQWRYSYCVHTTLAFLQCIIKLELGVGPSVPQHAVRQPCHEGVPEEMLCTRFVGFASHGAAAAMGQWTQAAMFLSEKTLTW